MIPRVYVAGSYTAPTRAVREYNVRAAVHVARLIIQAGAYPVVPHVTGIQLEDLKHDYMWWMRVTSDSLRTCQSMVVVPGSKKSAGTRAEVQQCIDEHRPFFGVLGETNVPESMRDWRLPETFFVWVEGWGR